MGSILFLKEMKNDQLIKKEHVIQPLTPNPLNPEVKGWQLLFLKVWTVYNFRICRERMEPGMLVWDDGKSHQAT